MIDVMAPRWRHGVDASAMKKGPTRFVIYMHAQKLALLSPIGSCRVAICRNLLSGSGAEQVT